MNTNIYKKVEEVNKYLANYKEGFVVKYEKGYKGNTEKDCFILSSNQFNACPIIYLTQEMMDMEPRKLADKLRTIFLCGAENIDIMGYINTEYVLDRVLPRIISNSNIEYLQKYNIPYIPYLDLVIYFGVPINEMFDDENHSIRVTNPLLKKLNLTVNEIYEAALRNIESDYQILNITQILSAFGEMGVDPEIPMWVLTNQPTIHGAAAILGQKALKQMEKHLGKKFIILPSSIHEVICLPYTEELAFGIELVRSINQNHLEPDEVLSNNVYVYENGKIRSFL